MRTYKKRAQAVGKDNREKPTAPYQFQECEFNVNMYFMILPKNYFEE